MLPGLTFASSRSLWILCAVPIVVWLGWAFGVRRQRIRPSVLVLRAATIALLVVAIAQPLTSAGGSARNTIFVVDRSQSLASGGDQQINQWVQGALNGAGSGDRAGIVSFGSSPVLSQSVSSASSIGSGWEGAAGVDGSFTDMESALALARALPVGGSRRIVLISDGAENLGSSLNQASQAAQDGVPIDVLPLPGIDGADLRVDGASAPSAIWSGDSLQILASIGSGEAGAATVSLVAFDGTTVSKLASKDITVQPGLNSVTFDVPDLTPGFHALAISVASSTVANQFTDNDSYPLAVIVRDAPKLLLVSEANSDPGRLKSALEQKGAVVTLAEPSAVSSELPDLSIYDGFVLDNVAATSFTYDQLVGLQQATKTLGKGLVVIGGRSSSYGPGSYAGHRQSEQRAAAAEGRSLAHHR
jgi:hypothetical protein